MTQLVYIAPSGTRWELIPGTQGVFVEQDSVEQLVGVFEDTTVDLVGMPGGVVDFRDRVVHPIEGTLAVVVRDTAAWKAFRAAWSTRREGVLELTVDGVVHRLAVRLKSPLAFPGMAPKPGARVTVPLIGDPAWTLSYSGSASVTITNGGDVPVYPVIVWTGSGQTVTLPSGAVLSLPAVKAESRFDLSPAGAGRVMNSSGVDAAATSAITSVSEHIPVGASRTFVGSSDVRIEWNVGRFDPWS